MTFYCPVYGIVWTYGTGARPVRPVYNDRGQIINLPHRPCPMGEKP